MSTSLRNKLFSSLLLVACFLVSGFKLSHALPIDNIDVNPVAAPYTAGIESGIVVQIYDSNSGAPTPSTPPEKLTFEVLVNDVVIPNAVSPSSIDIVEAINQTGEGTGTKLTIYRAGTGIKLRVRSSNGVTGINNTAFTVGVGPQNRLAVYGPEQDPIPGTNTSSPLFTGGISPKAKSLFIVRVVKTDQWFNPIGSGTELVSFTADDLTRTSGVPISLNLENVDGTRNFEVSIETPNTDILFTATSGSLNGSVTVKSAGPKKEQVFAYPSPFNPRLGEKVTFEFLTEGVKSCKVKVVDVFGQSVFERSVTSSNNDFTREQWDGRNDRGIVVAAGVYYVLLEVGGELKSKKRFGVAK